MDRERTGCDGEIWSHLSAAWGAARPVPSHPRFREAVRAAVGSLIEMYNRHGLPNRVVNDHGRVIGSLIALYLHFVPSSGGEDGAIGLTAGRFQALCVELKLCSPGRARALLALMRYAGYVAPALDRAADRRQRRLVPTERLIELHRQRWAYNFKAIALVMPETGRKALEALARPEFTGAFVHHLGVMYLAGFRPLHRVPDLERLIESNAGLLVIAGLFLAATDDRPVMSDGTPLPVSMTTLSAQFGITRTHARKLLVDAAGAGLVRRTTGSETVLVLPRLIEAVGDIFAAMFALQAHCAQAALEEIGGASLEAVSNRREATAVGVDLHRGGP
jgi:hypothetical protein